MPPTKTERLPVQKRLVNTFDSLYRILGYQDDWDGQGTRKPLLEIIRSAVRFTGRHMADPPDRIVVTPSGDILMEWHEGDDYREAEFTNGVVAEWMEIKDGCAPRHWEEAI